MPLPQARQERLRSLLASNEIATLIAVAEAKAIALESEAVNDVGQSNQFDKFTGKALGCIEQAVKYRHFVLVLKELKEENIHSTVKINQNEP